MRECKNCSLESWGANMDNLSESYILRCNQDQIAWKCGWNAKKEMHGEIKMGG